MKAAVYLVRGRTNEDQLSAFAEGIRHHGIDVVFFRDFPVGNADFAVVWGERVRQRIAGVFTKPVLVLERGFVGDRFQWTSAGWDGLNGRAAWPEIDDPYRWLQHFEGLVRSWRQRDGYALLVGQVDGDAALAGTRITDWYVKTARRLFVMGWDVQFRQHPVAVSRGHAVPAIEHAKVLPGSLDDALAGAGMVVTYNSNTAVESVISGVPTHAEDAGSMAYDVTSHDLAAETPDREAWMHRMAWRQWTLDELRSGAAWEVVGPVRF